MIVEGERTVPSLSIQLTVLLNIHIHIHTFPPGGSGSTIVSLFIGTDAAALLSVTNMATWMAAAFTAQIFPACVQGMTCIQLVPYQDRDLFFDCAVVNSSASPKGNVYFMHGNDGPYSKGMWSLMMQTLAGRGYNTLACDQRGYSPGASPYNVSDYNYDSLAQDLFALVDCHFGAGTEFHVVAHDQGSRVAFHSIAVSSARSRFASYTTLSIPHTDVFSDELFGPNQNPTQAINFQYLWALTLPGESVKAYNASIYHSLCIAAYGYTAPEACQTAIWWYTGAVESGALGMPPLTDDWGPIDLGIPVSYVKEHTPYPLEGSPQRVKVGLVTEFPILYICGEFDTADQCNDQARNGSAELIANFSYMMVPGCGHDLTDPQDCGRYQDVINATVLLIESVTPSRLPPSPSRPPRRHDPQLDLALISGYVCLLFLLVVLALCACCKSRRNATNPNKPLHLGTSLLGETPLSVNRQPGNLREHHHEQPLLIIT